MESLHANNTVQSGPNLDRSPTDSAIIVLKGLLYTVNMWIFTQAWVDKKFPSVLKFAVPVLNVDITKANIK